MKRPLILIFLSIFVTTESKYYEGHAFNNKSSSVRADIEHPLTTLDCGKHIGPICANDCRSLMICAGESTPVNVQVCEKQNRETPYCVDSICTALPDDSARCSVNSFQCTSNGIFPDPNDCYRYWSCTNKEAQMIQCPPHLVYSIDTKTCVAEKRCASCNAQNGKCLKINCSKQDNKFVTYQSSPGYYAFCGVPIIMFKCADEENYSFDTTTNKCRFNCKKSGYFADSLTCSKYFICERKGGEPIEMDCPEEHAFDGKACVYQPSCVPAVTA